MGDIKKKLVYIFFSLLRKSKELSNARDRDKTNLKKKKDLTNKRVTNNN